MAFSTQREVSDGTLVDVRLQIEYIDREDIRIFINDIPQAVGVDWDWVSDTLLQMRVPVPAGDELLVQRATALDGVLNVFVAGASFDDPTMDENFRQMLYIAQEAREGATLEEVFNDLNLHGFKITNLGAGTQPGDAINYQQYMDDALGAGGARVGAEAARNQAQTFRNQAETFATSAGTSRDQAVAASETSTAAMGAAQTARDQALVYRNASEGFAQSAATSASSIGDEVLQASKWAENPEDVPVTTNPDRFSAKHWALKAFAAVSGLINRPGGLLRQTIYTAGSATFTKLAATRRIEVEVIGGGGPGGAGGTAGGTSSFGTITATGGSPGSGGFGGAAGVGSGGQLNITGQAGSGIDASGFGGPGGSAPRGGGGGRAGGGGFPGSAGGFPGGGGGNTGGNSQTGGSGGYAYASIETPANTYTVVVGTAGIGGTGFPGAGGIVIVREYA